MIGKAKTMINNNKEGVSNLYALNASLPEKKFFNVVIMHMRY